MQAVRREGLRRKRSPVERRARIKNREKKGRAKRRRRSEKVKGSLRHIARIPMRRRKNIGTLPRGALQREDRQVSQVERKGKRTTRNARRSIATRSRKIPHLDPRWFRRFTRLVLETKSCRPSTPLQWMTFPPSRPQRATEREGVLVTMNLIVIADRDRPHQTPGSCTAPLSLGMCVLLPLATNVDGGHLDNTDTIHLSPPTVGGEFPSLPSDGGTNIQSLHLAITQDRHPLSDIYLVPLLGVPDPQSPGVDSTPGPQCRAADNLEPHLSGTITPPGPPGGPPHGALSVGPLTVHGDSTPSHPPAGGFLGRLPDRDTMIIACHRIPRLCMFQRRS